MQFSPWAISAMETTKEAKFGKDSLGVEDDARTLNRLWILVHA